MSTILLLSLVICTCTVFVSSRSIFSLPSFFRSLPRSYQSNENGLDDPLILKKTLLNSINNVTWTRQESSGAHHKRKNSGKINPGKAVTGQQCSSGDKGECAKSPELLLSSENKVAESVANVTMSEKWSNQLETDSAFLIKNEKVALNGSLKEDDYTPYTNFENVSTRNASDFNVETEVNINSNTFSGDTLNILSTSEDSTLQSFTFDQETLNGENEETSIKTTSISENIFETEKYLDSSNVSTNAKNILNSAGDLINVKPLSEKNDTVESFIFDEKMLSEENKIPLITNGSHSTDILDFSEDFSSRNSLANESFLIEKGIVTDLPFSENNSFQLFTFDESDLSEDEIPFFQDESTVDFQFLVDSQNPVLTELLKSGMSVIDEDNEKETEVSNNIINDSIIKIKDFDSSLGDKTDVNVMDKATFDGLETHTEISETIRVPECPAPVLLSRSFDLEEFIPKDYDRFIPPKTSEDEAVNVTVSLYVIQIRSVDETNMNFKIDILIRQQWKDHRLNFPSVIGTKKVVIDPSWRSEMWTPDVWFKNALDTKLQEWEVPMVFYWLEKENVCFSGRVTLELSCDMEMHRYPHDTQTCGVDIMALMDSMTDLNLQWKKDHPIRLSKILTLPQFEVTNVTDTRCDSIMYGEMFSCIRAAFTLIRRGGYFLINIYIPTVLIVAMSMLTFWIPPEAVPARITLGVTSLLTIITKQYQASMPNVSYVVAMNIWLSCCVAFVFCSLLEYGIVLSISEKNKNKVTVIPENADGDKPQDDKSVRKSFKAAWKAKTCTYFENRSAHYLDVISRFAFPIFFALFCIAYCGKYSY